MRVSVRFIAVAAACLAAAVVGVDTATAQPATPGAQAMTLSLERARQLALEKNYTFRAQVLNPLISDAQVSDRLGSLDPTLRANIDGSHTETPNQISVTTVIDTSTGAQQQYVTSTPIPASDGLEGSVSLSKLFSYGTQTSVSVRSSWVTRSNTDSWNSRLTLDVTQPLLKGFGKEATIGGVLLAQNSQEQSAIQLEQNAFETIIATESAYWNLVLAREQLEVAKLALNAAQQLLDRSKARIESGAQAQYELLSAEAEVAARRQEIIQRQAAVGQAQDELKRLTGIAQLPIGWGIDILPTEQPLVATRVTAADSLVSLAMQSRPDVRIAEQQREARLLSLRLQHNARMPSLDATGGLSLADGSPRSYSRSFDEIVTVEYPSWNVGLRLSMPIGNRSADGQYRQARLQVRQTELAYQALQLRVHQELRDAVRTVESTREQIQAAEVTVNLREADLSNQEERLRLGLATNYDVLLKERDLADARRSLLQAQISHQKAIVNLQAATGELLEVRGIRVQPREDENDESNGRG